MAQIVGSIISLELAFGDVVHLKTKHMQMAIAMAVNCLQVIAISIPIRAEITYWLHHLALGNWMTLEPAIAARIMSYSDASGQAAATLLAPGPDKITWVAHYTFSESENKKVAPSGSFWQSGKGWSSARTCYTDVQ